MIIGGYAVGHYHFQKTAVVGTADGRQAVVIAVFKIVTEVQTGIHQIDELTEIESESLQQGCEIIDVPIENFGKEISEAVGRYVGVENVCSLDAAVFLQAFFNDAQLLRIFLADFFNIRFQLSGPFEGALIIIVMIVIQLFVIRQDDIHFGSIGKVIVITVIMGSYEVNGTSFLPGNIRRMVETGQQNADKGEVIGYRLAAFIAVKGKKTVAETAVVTVIDIVLLFREFLFIADEITEHETSLTEKGDLHPA